MVKLSRGMVECSHTDLPLALLAAFYTFNKHYPEGCNNIYSFLEATLLGKKHPRRKTHLGAVLATLSNNCVHVYLAPHTCI